MDTLEKCYGQHGWREFHRNRKNILAEFDKLLEQTSNRPVQTAHGAAVEAFLRRWLAEFLPKKFGVTSGYIIPDIYSDAGKIYHFDIIVYDVLEAPVLWTEGNEDNSEQGKSRAIPAQHVIAVYEVKSRLTKQNVTDALSKLDQIKEFETQLNKNYSCGVIFIDLKESDNNKSSIIQELYAGKDVIGFNGGMVLRYEGDHTCTGLISIHRTESKEVAAVSHCTPLAKPIDSLAIYLTEDGNLEISERGGGAKLVATSSNNWSVAKSYGVFFGEGELSVHLNWSRSNFSEFCIDLIGRLEGLPFNDSKRPSFGRVFDSIQRKQTLLQGPEPHPGAPFLVISLHEPNGDRMRISYDDLPPTIEFWVQVENQGEGEATISDDHYATSCTLPAGKKAIKAVKLSVRAHNNDFKLRDAIESEGLEIPYRLVYQSNQGEKEFFAIERTVKIIGSGINLC
jgi:hypothetical protein